MIEDGELHAEVEQIMIEEGLRQVQIEMEATQAMIDYILEIIEGQILWIPVDEEEENFVTDIINDILAGISTDYLIDNYGIEEESLGILMGGIESYNGGYEEFLFDNYIYSVKLWDMYNSNIERI